MAQMKQIRELRNAGKSIDEIGHALNMHAGSVGNLIGPSAKQEMLDTLYKNRPPRPKRPPPPPAPVVVPEPASPPNMTDWVEENGSMVRRTKEPDVQDLVEVIAKKRAPSGPAIESDFWKENIDKLRDLAAAGKSYSEIANELKVSRNTIAGKMRRSQLTTGNAPPPWMRTEPSAPAPAPAPTQKAPKGQLSDADLAEFLRIFGGK